MNKIICLILCWALTVAYAERPSWYPENTEEIAKKCYDDNQLEPGFEKDLLNNQLTDDPKVHEFFLCKAKGVNIYSDDMGLNVDRLVYGFYRSTSNLDSKKPLVQDCVDNYKDVAPAAKMFFKVFICILEKEHKI